MNLKNKKILITAGSTSVPIDSVRVISNIATGESGLLLAEELHKRGAKVTLLLGPTDCLRLNKKIKLIRFNFFDELFNTIKKELNQNKYDIVIHSAAVSDYKPKLKYTKKLKSGKKIWRLNLVPTPKIIELIKKIDKSIFLVGFKFEPQAGTTLILKNTGALLRAATVDLAVGNSIYKNRYIAYIVNNRKNIGPFYSKENMVKNLIDIMGESL